MPTANCRLLDCTLRDGGFVNDWNFGFGSIKSIISRLDCAGIDIIEVGFVDKRHAYDENRSIFPDTNSILPVFRNINKPRAMIVGMIDYGTCPLENVSSKSNSCLDGIRVIFKKNDQDGALHFAAQLKEKGYRIFLNPVSITGYSDRDVIGLIAKINIIDPYAVSIVDTYGLMHSRELLHYFKIFDKNLRKNTLLAYHAHNNFQMAYANSIAVLNSGIERPVIIDASLYGMGKSAGNACTELVAMYMNECCGRDFDINQLQEAIDVDIQKEYQKKAWGYNFEYYISALNDCHPSYVEFFIDKRCLSVRTINLLLQKIPTIKKLSFDNAFAERIYEEYQNKNCDDSAVIKSLQEAFGAKPILLLGPGKTLLDNLGVITGFIQDKKPIIVSINFLHEQIPIDYVFIGNAKRYSQFFDKIYGEYSSVKIICTSNITEAGKRIDYIVNYSTLISSNEVIQNNPLILFLHLLEKMRVGQVWLAGFDGYVKDNTVNYYGEYIRYLYCLDNVMLRNDAIREDLKAMAPKMKIQSLTETKYL